MKKLMFRGRNNRGAVLVMVAAGTVALIGMGAIAIDLGRLYVAKGRAQDICDSAAISAAYHLDGTTAGETPSEEVAQSTADSNVSSLTSWKIYNSATSTTEDVVVDWPSGDITTAAGKIIEDVQEGEAVQVDGWVHVDFGLGLIFNVLGGNRNSGRARASATAIRRLLQGGSGNPYINLGVSDLNESTYEPGYEYDLKTGNWQDDWLGAGNFGLVDLGGAGHGDASEQLSGAAINPVWIGKVINTMEGDKVGPMNQGMNDRLYDTGNNDTQPGTPTQYADGEYDVWYVEDGHPWDARIVICPIIHQEDPLNGQNEITIIGFAAFYIDNFEYQGGNQEDRKTITGVFVEAVYGERWQVLDILNEDDNFNRVPVHEIRLVS